MTEELHPQLYKHVGQRLKERRRVLNISQGRLAELLGISYQQVQKYESGQSQLSLSRLLQFSQLLNVGPEFFYEDMPTEGLGEKIQSDVIDRHRNRPLQILLVEDNPADAILFDRAISPFRAEVSVYCLNDPELTMDYFNSHLGKYGQPAPDLLVVDLNMPKMSGLQLLKELKNNSKTQMTPVVILTHSISRRDMDDAYRLGAAGFIQKSMDLEDYKESIEGLVKYWLRAVTLPVK